jgi:hypothetical protein
VLVPGGDVALVTAGQFGLSHLVAAVVAQTGPAACDIATWTAGRRAIGHLRRLHASGQLTAARWWLDPSFARRQPAYLDALFAGFGRPAVRLAPVHAKVVVLRNAAWGVVVRGSLNLNHAVRAELIEISDDRPMADWLAAVVDDVFAVVPAPVDGAALDDGTALARVFGVDASRAEPGMRPVVFGPALDDPGRPGFSEGV